MRQAKSCGIIGTFAVAALVATGCASTSGSGTGVQRAGHEERIGEQPIRSIDYNRSVSALGANAPEFSTGTVPGPTQESFADILFDFDRATIRADALPVVEFNAKRLKHLEVGHVLLEGRGDEVGTAAYNLVLGERRAANVKQYLQQLGLTADIKITSYGKDRPLCFEHTSECMQKNRSVRFVVKN